MNKSLRTEPLGWTSVLLALFTAAGWGGNGVATRFAVDTLPPIFSAAVRFALATLFMLGWCLLVHGGVGLRRDHLKTTSLLGFFMFLQIATFTIGVQLSNASHGTMLINTATFWVILIEHFVTHSDRLTARKLTGVMVAALGTFVVLATSRRENGYAGVDEPSLLGDLVLVLSAAILGVNIVFTRHVVRTVEPNKLVFWQDLIATGLMFAWSWAAEDVSGERWPPSTVVALAYQGVVVGGLCFAIQARLLQRHAAAQVSVFGFAAPLFGFVAAALFRDDPLSPWLFAAVLLLAWGIVLVNRSAE